METNSSYEHSDEASYVSWFHQCRDLGNTQEEKQGEIERKGMEGGMV